MIADLDLSQYDRIDPAEVQALKDQIEQLTTAKAELEAQKDNIRSTDANKVCMFLPSLLAL